MYIGEYVPSGYWLTVSFAFVVSFQIRFYFSLISLFFEVASLNEYLIVSLAVCRVLRWVRWSRKQEALVDFDCSCLVLRPVCNPFKVFDDGITSAAVCECVDMK